MPVLPYVRIDPALPGAVCSREAAKAWATKRMLDQRACDQRVADCETTCTILRHRAEDAERTSARAEWWHIYGPGLLGGGIVGALILGAATALWAMQAVAR